jgi:hypothetical protein
MRLAVKLARVDVRFSRIVLLPQSGGSYRSEHFCQFDKLWSVEADIDLFAEAAFLERYERVMRFTG